MQNLNKKGFTLIELLAVIVVLAIVMIIAVPNVLDSMSEAKKKAFQVYAQEVLTNGTEKHQQKIIFGSTDTTACYYDIADLKNGSTGDYKGYIIVTPVPDNKGSYTYNYTVALSDKNFHTGTSASAVSDVKSSELTDGNHVWGGDMTASITTQLSGKTKCN